MSKLNLWRTFCIVCIFCALAVIGLSAETFTSLVSFNGSDGESPTGSLVQGLNGNFYGTAPGGGAHGEGMVFEITAGGKLTTLYNFCSQSHCTDGAYPLAGLVQAINGNFYGTTAEGGTSSNCTHGCGTVFEITPGGKLTTGSFNGGDGTDPEAAPVQGIDGNLYGTTLGGGAHGDGTVFKITAEGKLTTLHSFCSQPGCADGANPLAGLVQATDGNFYGTTSKSGAHGDGTVFKITPGGRLTTLHSFDYTDGETPYAGLVQATNENFYGTTELGGAHGNGTVFEITPSGSLITLHSFCSQPGCTDGAYPLAGLAQATDGNFYGTTALGGLAGSACLAGGCGTVFEMNARDEITTLHSFDFTDGETPSAALVQATNGNFYGTTANGGTSSACFTYGCGTVFSLAVGLGPFVETLPTSGKVGMAITVLGNNLTGAASVTFNGTPAAFMVVSSTEIKTTVPSGAITGKVKVTTPSGTLTSNVNFRVSCRF